MDATLKFNEKKEKAYALANQRSNAGGGVIGGKSTRRPSKNLNTTKTRNMRFSSWRNSLPI